MGAAFLVSDFISNVINLYLSPECGGWRRRPGPAPPDRTGGGRSFTAAMILWGSRYYHRLLLRQEHERRYQRLFLMTAELKKRAVLFKKRTPTTLNR